jgi:nucleoside-diphosphate-sugar epimerase
MSDPVLLTLGHGYSGGRLAATLPGWRRLGTVRTPEKAQALAAAGIEPIPWDDSRAVDRAVAAASHVLVSVPPDAAGDPVLRRLADALRAASPVWIGYLSTTGVYGDRNGDWVDEDGARAPVNERSRWRVGAEDAWLASGLPVTIFRLAGIYGPGRSAFDRLRAGRAQRIVKPGQVFSRIHVDDVATVLRAAMARGAPGRAYNVADDEPAPPQDVIAHAAELLGVPVPPEVRIEDATLTTMARSFYAESKRVSNRRIREELGVALAYPTYREGLAAILAAGG